MKTRWCAAAHNICRLMVATRSGGSQCHGSVPSAVELPCASTRPPAGWWIPRVGFHRWGPTGGAPPLVGVPLGLDPLDVVRVRVGMPPTPEPRMRGHEGHWVEPHTPLHGADSIRGDLRHFTSFHFT